MNERGVKQYIIDNERLPDDIDIIFINSACREGLNIKDKNVKTIICEAVDLITIEQILGRVRGDLENFMVVCNYNNAERVRRNIAELADFLKEIESANRPSEILSERYGRQKENKNL